jgi:hypothetical protein
MVFSSSVCGPAAADGAADGGGLAPGCPWQAVRRAAARSGIKAYLELIA